MATLFRALRRNLGIYISLTAGGATGYVVATRNLSDVRQVVSRDMLEISDDGGHPYVHVERKLQFLSLLPLRTLSRAFGYIADVELPGFILRPFLKQFVKTYDVHLDEAVDPDLSHYKTIGSFFNREIKMNECRNIDLKADLISPCDGRILALGRVSAVEARKDHFKVEQVKGVTFSLTSFLGSPLSHFPSTIKQKSEEKNTDLFFCTIYLAPGDFHGFVNPADWQVFERRHFSGRLFSVKPTLAEVVKPLFTLNERVLYTGLWQHGFFSFTAVGATNVGNIEIDFDKDLLTNRLSYLRPYDGKKFDENGTMAKDVGAAMNVFKRGDMFGRFRLGSTIVLIFEAPHTTQFRVEPGQRVAIGQSLTNLKAKH